ncbi:FixH family protein [Roseinatronobacter sp. NSM]|uniref:FixH family protein n=1 Tax=Roseinatronobacter sp. NSM TaxID=3457785 RepID=UPI00403732E2
MTQTAPKGFRMTGTKVLVICLSAFGVILAANLTLAFNAVNTFPGLEVDNSYVASQNFNAELAAQLSLGWDVKASVEDGALKLAITDAQGAPVQVAYLDAVVGAATHVRADQTPDFRFVDGAYRAPVEIGPGNWNIRMHAVAADGTEFRQRVVLHVR